MRQPKILTTLRHYDRATFLADVAAGITVAMVAIPLSIAIAIASGAAPSTGLTTAIVAGFLISALGGSRVQVGGPTGAFIVVVFGVIAEHGHDGLILATFMAGFLLLVAGYLRAGRLMAHVPEAVINGFTIGIAIIIASSQIENLLGLAGGPFPADMVEKVPALWERRDTINMAAAAMALLSIGLIVALRRLAPRLPGLIVAVGIASFIVMTLGLDVDTLASRYGELPSTLPRPALPELSLPRLIELLPSAIVIAFLAGVESLLSAMVADRMITGNHRPNAELTAQGAANIASALFAGLPATGAIARTATNIRAGGKTPVAGIVHALVVLLVMLFFAPHAGHLAMPALAALLLLTAWNMSEPHNWPRYVRLPMDDRFLLVLTLVLTVLVDLTVAIAVGVAVGLLLKKFRAGTAPDDWTPPER